MLRGMSTNVKRSAGAYRKFPFIFSLSHGEEFHCPIDGSQQLFSHEGGQASGKKRADRSGDDDD